LRIQMPVDLVNMQNLKMPEGTIGNFFAGKLSSIWTKMGGRALHIEQCYWGREGKYREAEKLTIHPTTDGSEAAPLLIIALVHLVDMDELRVALLAMPHFLRHLRHLRIHAETFPRNPAEPLSFFLNTSHHRQAECQEP
jgi:hypothetical protein